MTKRRKWCRCGWKKKSSPFPRINVDKTGLMKITSQLIKYVPEREEISDLEGSLKSLKV